MKKDFYNFLQAELRLLKMMATRIKEQESVLEEVKNRLLDLKPKYRVEETRFFRKFMEKGGISIGVQPGRPGQYHIVFLKRGIDDGEVSRYLWFDLDGECDFLELGRTKTYALSIKKIEYLESKGFVKADDLAIYCRVSRKYFIRKGKTWRELKVK